jgi:hypothetical protein
MPRCKGHKLSFTKLKSGDFKASDTFCGVSSFGKIWYCSEQCRDEQPKLKYDYADEEISND